MIETVLVPSAVGVPEITPVVELIVSPVGIPVAVQEYGGTPPAAETVAE